MSDKEVKITIEPDGKIIEAGRGETFRSALSRSGYFFPQNCGGKGQCGHCRIEFENPQPKMLPREIELLGAESTQRLACLRRVNQDTIIRLPAVLEWSGDKTITDFAVAGSNTAGYGIAVDLGTTLVALYLADLSKGAIMAQASFLNPQVHYGGDVMTRLEQAKSEDQRKILTDIVHRALEESINTLLVRTGVPGDKIRRTFISGNTAMTHLLLGRGGEGLERAPFRSPLEGNGILNLDSTRIGLDSDCLCEICPVIRGFIGGDTTAAIVAAGLDQNSGNRLLIDLGTNGEIVLSVGGKLWATSTAAGPAFEGVGMHDGMPALKGAIEGLSETGEPFVIGGGEPLGFCGSGYISAMAYILKTRIMNPTGLLEKNAANKRVWSPLQPSKSSPAIYQDDVRKFQLAKGAIAAGIEILRRAAGIKITDIDEIFVTGSFGNRIDPQATMEIGLIPSLPLDRVIFLDNAAGRGALFCLASEDYKARAVQLQKDVNIINLGDHPDFQDAYIANMSFPG